MFGGPGSGDATSSASEPCDELRTISRTYSSLLFVVTGKVTRTRASIIRRRGYITGTGTMAQVSSPDG